MVKFVVALLLSAPSCALAADPIAFMGTFTNTTNPKTSLSADALMTFDKDGHCILRISPPLYGSGTCAIKSYDQSTGHVEFTSEGALLNIIGSGTAKDNLIAGSYTVISPSTPELPQKGTFQFTVAPSTQQPLQLSDALSWATFKSGEEEFLLIRDGNVASVHHRDGRYAGLRMLLGNDGNPACFVQDSDKVSVYRDGKTQNVLVTWVRDGDDGFFIQPVTGGNKYLDRYMQPTGFASIEVNKQTIFLHELNGDVELLDANLRPLGIRSAKTSSGQVYWSKATGEVTEYFDQSFKALGWYSVQMNGSTYYAHARGKNKYTFYDASMRELKKPSTGFWASFARGLSAGLAAYGTAMQQAAAYRAQQAAAQPYQPQTAPYQYPSYQPPVYQPSVPSYRPPSYNSTTISQPRMSTTTTTDSVGNTYMTNSQRMGAFTFSNTTGSNGYTANSTTTQMGPFAYMNGTSSSGNFSGSSNRLGNFEFSNLTTPGGTWTGTSNHMGNFTFHNITGPNGQMLTGTSVRMGDFIFTNVH